MFNYIRYYFMRYFYYYDDFDVLFSKNNRKEQLVVYAGRCSVSAIIDIETTGYNFNGNG